MLTITQVKNVFVQSGRNIYTNILVFWKTVVYNASSELRLIPNERSGNFTVCRESRDIHNF